jgi:hypothetical protein
MDTFDLYTYMYLLMLLCKALDAFIDHVYSLYILSGTAYRPAKKDGSLISVARLVFCFIFFLRLLYVEQWIDLNHYGAVFGYLGGLLSDAQKKTYTLTQRCTVLCLVLANSFLAAVITAQFLNKQINVNTFVYSDCNETGVFPKAREKNEGNMNMSSFLICQKADQEWTELLIS